MPALNIVRRIGQAVGLYKEVEPASQTTTRGLADATFSKLYSSYFELSSERLDIYDDMEMMEGAMTEIGVGLDILAGSAVISADGSEMNFQIRYAEEPEEGAKELITELLETTQLPQKVFAIARELLKFGDKFLQPVINRDLKVVRVMSMPVKSIVRNEDEAGLLKSGTSKGNWAFEQYIEGTRRFVAGFYPWQIIHLRWARQGEDRYGRPLLYSSRADFKKLQAMEEALTINWLTRAFARLLFEIDTTGMSREESERYIDDFKRKLQKRQMQSGDLQDEPLSVIKDIFLAGGYHKGLADDPLPLLQKVSVLDTSNTGFQNLAPVEYFRSKIIMGMRVPPSYLGLERDVNSKATLQEEEIQMVRMLRRIQMLLSEAVTQIIDLGLILGGYNPREVLYQVVWPNTSRTDDRTKSQALFNYAQSDALYRQNEVIDSEWIAKNRLSMTDDEWERLSERIQKQVEEQRQRDMEQMKQEAALNPKVPNNGSGRQQHAVKIDKNDNYGNRD